MTLLQSTSIGLFWWKNKLHLLTAEDREKLSAKYHRLTIDWKRVYLLSLLTTLETKLREFQFKILNRIVFMNEKLFRFDMAESDKCAFCQTEFESIEHLLFSGKISSVFWKHVLSWLRDNNIIVQSLKEEDIIIGKFDVGNDFLLESYFIAWEVLYFFHKKVKRVCPPFRGSLLGLGVFTTLNFILPGKEAH